MRASRDRQEMVLLHLLSQVPFTLCKKSPTMTLQELPSKSEFRDNCGLIVNFSVANHFPTNVHSATLVKKQRTIDETDAGKS